MVGHSGMGQEITHLQIQTFPSKSQLTSKDMLDKINPSQLIFLLGSQHNHCKKEIARWDDGWGVRAALNREDLEVAFGTCWYYFWKSLILFLLMLVWSGGVGSLILFPALVVIGSPGWGPWFFFWSNPPHLPPQGYNCVYMHILMNTT